MRYEAKHSYFKRLAQITGNFKNIAKSLAGHHQQYMRYHMSNASYLRRDLEYKKGTHIINIYMITMTVVVYIDIYYIGNKERIQSLDYKDRLLAMSS